MHEDKSIVGHEQASVVLMEEAGGSPPCACVVRDIGFPFEPTASGNSEHPPILEIQPFEIGRTRRGPCEGSPRPRADADH
jgi:hypothetical protein